MVLRYKLFSNSYKKTYENFVLNFQNFGIKNKNYMHF